MGEIEINEIMKEISLYNRSQMSAYNNDVEEDASSDENFRDEQTETFFDDTKESEEEPILEKNSSLDIEGAPYQRDTDGKYHKTQDLNLDADKLSANVPYSTQDAANVLNVTPQTIRNYVEMYKEFLPGLSFKEKGQRIFKKETIEKLRDIIELKDNRHFTSEQVREYLRTPLDDREPVSEKEKAEVLVNEFSKAFQERFSIALDRMKEECQLMLEESTRKSIEDKESYAEQIKDKLGKLEDSLSKVEDQQKSIDELKELIEKKFEEKSSNELDALREEMSNLSTETNKLKEELKKTQDANKKLQKENESLKNAPWWKRAFSNSK